MSHSLIHAIEEETPKIASLLGHAVPASALPNMVRGDEMWGGGKKEAKRRPPGHLFPCL